MEANNSSLDFWKNIFLLLAAWFFCAVAGQLTLGAVAPVLGIGDPMAAVEAMGRGQYLEHIPSLRILLGISHLFSFLIPALVFIYVVARRSVAQYAFLNRPPRVAGLGVGLLAVILSYPISMFLYYLNMLVPQAWHSSEAGDLVKLVMTMPSAGAFAQNLVLIGVLAGVGEEMLFRGVLQRIFVERTGNWHLAIWLAAATFSLIHFEAQAFLPRLALGALFGYLFRWSGTLWIPIIAHTLFNSAQVFAIYFGGLAPDSNPQTQELDAAFWAILAVSTIGFVFLMRLFRQMHRNDALQ